MENTLENRNRFVALHYGGDLVFVKGNYNYKTGSTIKIDADAIKYFASPTAGLSSTRTAVLLTPLSQITDEDAIMCYNLHFGNLNNDVRPNESRITFSKRHIINPTEVVIPIVVDYLRSRGYALPYMGVSVETLVQWGWVKLKGHQ